MWKSLVVAALLQTVYVNGFRPVFNSKILPLQHSSKININSESNIRMFRPIRQLDTAGNASFSSCMRIIALINFWRVSARSGKSERNCRHRCGSHRVGRTGA